MTVADAKTAHGIFRWVASSDKSRPHELHRPSNVKLRLAQITDIHVPGEIDITQRLRDLADPSDSIGEFTHRISALGNQFGHPYRSTRRIYSNLLKKALVGLHRCDVDHLAITGDLVHCGLAPEFLEMRALLEVTGWWGEEKLTVVPGNHDRFNLYDRLRGEPMEQFFDVAGSREPRIKKLPGGVALVEVDSNRDRGDDRRYVEAWLPNTVGEIYPEAIDSLDKQLPEIRGMRVITLLHHHLSSDWYGAAAESLAVGLMDPAENRESLFEVVEQVDRHGVFLHGHKHDVMEPGYTIGSHPIGCPGGFAETLGLNLIDMTDNDELIITQIAVIP